MVINNLPPIGDYLRGQSAEKFTGSLLEQFDRVNNAAGFYVDDLQSEVRGFYHRGKIVFERRIFRPSSSIRIGYIFNQGDILYMTSYVPEIAAKWQATEALETTFLLVHELIHGYFTPITGPMQMKHLYMERAARKAIIHLGKNTVIPYREIDFNETDKNGDKTQDIPKAAYFEAVLRELCGNIKL